MSWPLNSSIKNLTDASHRCRATNEGIQRTAAYEAITSFVTHATADTIPVVQNTAVTILMRMEQLLSMQVRTF